MMDHCADSLIVGIHIRRGDFGAPGKGTQSRIPTEWYFDWLHSMQQDFPNVLHQAKRAQDSQCPACVGQSCDRPFNVSNIIIFLASDEQTVADEFKRAGFTIVTTPQIQGREYDGFAALNEGVTKFYVDWWLLSQMQTIATSHSTYSLTATIFNTREAGVDAFYFWPDPATMSIQPLNPRAFWYDGMHFKGKDFSKHKRFVPNQTQSS